MIRSIVLICLTVICGASHSYSQLIVSPFSLSKEQENPGVIRSQIKAASGRDDFGFLPFTREKKLQKLYDSQLFNPTKLVSLSLVNQDSSESATSYAEVLSYIPPSSVLRASLAIQLTDSNPVDTSRGAENALLQKFLHGGGNIMIALRRPVYYDELYAGNFACASLVLTAFADVPALNKNIYNPGAGLQGSLDIDVRVLTAGTDTQDGNVFRLGVRCRAAANFVNEKYAETSDSTMGKQSSLLSLQPYIGFAFIDFEYTLNWFAIKESNGNTRNADNQLLRFTVIPVKF